MFYNKSILSERSCFPMNNSSIRISHLTRAALIAAIIFVMTSYLKLPTATGYVHLGDAAVCLAALILPTPLAITTAALGAGLADLAAGYPQWILATALIKALMTLAFTSKGGKMLSARNFIAMGLAVIINAGGYYIAGSLIYGSFISTLSEVPANLIQGACGVVLAFLVSAFLDSHEGVKKIVRGR